MKAKKLIIPAAASIAGMAGSGLAIPPATYVDGRTQARLRLAAIDKGTFSSTATGHRLGAREAIVKGWLATNEDLAH